MKNSFKRIACAVLAVLCCLPLYGCGGSGDETTDKPVITILAEEETSSMELYWTCLAARFPEVKFDISIYKSLLPEEGIHRRVEHGDVADITFSKYLSTDLPGLSECFMDLSGKPYVSSYQTSYLNDLDVDGSLYYLPADLIIGGLLYNKTLFEEMGWDVPQSYGEFVELCAACEEAGIKAVYLSSVDRSQTDLFLKCYALEKGHSLKSEIWLEEFNSGMATARDGELEGVFSLLDRYVADGAVTAEEVGLLARDKYYRIAGRQTAIIGGDATLIRVVLNASSTDELRLMPFFSPEDDKGYFFVYPMLNLAVGKHVEEDPEKEQIIDEILRYITSEEGQQDLMRYDKGVISPIIGIPNKTDDPFYENLSIDALSQENLLKMPSFDRCAGVLDDMIGQYLRGEADMDEVIEAVDQKNGSGKDGNTESPLAQAERDFTVEETNALVLDAMRSSAGTDAALLMKRTPRHALDFQCLNGVIYEGDVTLTDLYCVHPYAFYIEKSVGIDRVTLTGNQLLELLPYRATYYHAGFTVQYSWDRERNDYIPVGLLDEDGTQLPLDGEYTVAVLETSALRGVGDFARTETSVLLIDAMRDYVQAKGRLTPSAVSPAVCEK